MPRQDAAKKLEAAFVAYHYQRTYIVDGLQPLRTDKRLYLIHDPDYEHESFLFVICARLTKIFRRIEKIMKTLCRAEQGGAEEATEVRLQADLLKRQCEELGYDVECAWQESTPFRLLQAQLSEEINLTSDILQKLSDYCASLTKRTWNLTDLFAEEPRRVQTERVNYLSLQILHLNRVSRMLDPTATEQQIISQIIQKALPKLYCTFIVQVSPHLTKTKSIITFSEATNVSDNHEIHHRTSQNTRRKTGLHGRGIR